MQDSQMSKESLMQFLRASNRKQQTQSMKLAKPFIGNIQCISMCALRVIQLAGSAGQALTSLAIACLRIMLAILLADRRDSVSPYSRLP